MKIEYQETKQEQENKMFDIVFEVRCCHSRINQKWENIEDKTFEKDLIILLGALNNFFQKYKHFVRRIDNGNKGTKD